MFTARTRRSVQNSVSVGIVLHLFVLSSPLLADGFLTRENTDTGEDWLWQIPLGTEHGSQIGPTGFSGISGLAFDFKGHLYGVASSEDHLILIDTTTGVAWQVGPLGVDIDGRGALSFDVNGDLWLASNEMLYSIDRVTGEASEVAEIDAAFPVTGMSACGSTMLVVYSVDSYYSALGTLDTATGEVTPYGSEVSYIDGLGLDFDEYGSIYALDDFVSGVGTPAPFTNGVRLVRLQASTGLAMSSTWKANRAAVGGFAIGPPRTACPRTTVVVPTLGVASLTSLGALLALCGWVVLGKSSSFAGRRAN